MGLLLIIVITFLIIWLLVVLPQRRRQAAQGAMLEALEPGDEVLTAGGLYGTVADVGDDEVRLEVDEGVHVRVAKRAIATVLPREDDEELDVEEAEEPLDVAPEALPPHDEADVGEERAAPAPSGEQPRGYPS